MFVEEFVLEKTNLFVIQSLSSVAFTCHALLRPFPGRTRQKICLALRAATEPISVALRAESVPPLLRKIRSR